MEHVTIFLSSFFISLLAVPPLRQWAVSSGRVDLPERRKIHKEAIPRIGGIAIFASFLFAVLVFHPFGNELRGLLAGCLIMFLLGLVDDLSGLSPRQKLLGQVVAASLAIALSGLYLTSLGNLFGFGAVDLPPWFGIPFTVFAIVGVANAVNMLDGLDGLAGGVSVIALGGFLFLAWQADDVLVIGICLALLGAILGFLKDNSYPASIFMGDSGSLVLGFVLGLLAVFLVRQPGPSIEPIVPVLILGLPIVDTLTVMGRRMRKGLSPFFPDLTHVHHKFLNLGFHHRFTVIIIYSVTLAWTVAAISGAGEVPEYLFFWGYLVFVVAMYAVLRHLLKHRDRYPFLQQDSTSSLRKSALHERLVSCGRHVATALVVLIGCYLLLAVTTCTWSAPALTLNLSLLVLAGGLLLLAATRTTRPRVMMIFYVSATLLTVFVSEQNCSSVVIASLPLETIVNVIFMAVGGLVIYKIVFREQGKVYLTTPLDFLLLAITLSFAIVSPEISQNLRLADVCVKTIVLILAIKILASHSRTLERFIFWGLQSVLLVFIVRNIF